MTRYPPQGPPQGNHDYSQGSGQGYYSQQPPYGEQQPQYGQYSAQEGRPYGQPTSNYGQPTYGSPAPTYAEPEQGRGSAHSYYGSNDQPYQQYPPQHTGPQYSQQPYGGTAPYGGPGQQYPPSGQQPYGAGYPTNYAYPPPAEGPEIEGFKSHFDQHQPETSGYGQPPASYGQPPHNQSPYGAPVPGPAYNHPPPTYGEPTPYNQPPYNAAPPGPDSPEDRGVMGALAGGAAGGFAGHKVNHGFLGTLGGAVAGSILEDQLKAQKKKKDKKEKKPKKHGASSSSSSSSSSSDSDSSKKKQKKKKSVSGNFLKTSRNLRLEDSEHHCVLIADCADVNGHWHESRLDLNDCLTNERGDVKWARGGHFRASVKEVRLTSSNFRYLVCKAGNGGGGWYSNTVALNERIGNQDGRLVFLD